MPKLLRILQNGAIAAGVELFVWFVRAKHRVRALVKPGLGYIDHVTIPVHDLDVARRFYCDVLGAVEIMTIDAEALRRFGRPPAANGGDGVFHVSLCVGGTTRLDLFLQRLGQPALAQGHPHYAFRVSPRAMQTWKRRLESFGVPTEGPLQLGFPGQASLYFNDPSGNHLEIVSHGFSDVIPIRPPVMTGLAWGPTLESPTGSSAAAG